MQKINLAFIGAVGLPNRYGGFEAFLEHCAPELAKLTDQVIVTCDAHVYPDRHPVYRGVSRRFIGVRANGAASIVHDFLAFFSVYSVATHIFVLGVSGGVWFPFFRLMCFLGGKRLIVNVDGVEWKRTKFSFFKRGVIRAFDFLAQRFSNVVIYDNDALCSYVLRSSLAKSVMIPYSGDHVLRCVDLQLDKALALTICRIEPENNIEMLLDGFLLSGMEEYLFVGNWDASRYGKALRARYGAEKRLKLLDPIYDSEELAKLRERCGVYIHGHSVGGTNPSLVEMLFYDCRILCFDVPFHHETTKNQAEFFLSADELGRLLDIEQQFVPRSFGRELLREKYTSQHIASQYLHAALGRPGETS